MEKKIVATFVEKIVKDITVTLADQQTYCQFQKNILPYDNTNTTNLLIYQELYDVGESTSKFITLLKRNCSKLQQDKAIFYAAATSGIGKTHQAYALGKDKTFSIVIRLADKIENSSLSQPWQSLNEKLRALYDINEDSEKRADKALILIKLLIYSYLEATISALKVLFRMKIRR